MGDRDGRGPAVTGTFRGLSDIEVKIKLAEYERAQDMLKHYDALNWQIGSILIGANAVLTGLVVNVLPKIGWLGFSVAAAVALFSFGLLDTWSNWFSRHRDLYNFRNETLQRIEVQLGMYHFLPVARASLEGKLTPAKVEMLTPEMIAQDDNAHDVAYGVARLDKFVPLYPGLSIGGSGGKDTVRWLRTFVPIVEFVTLALVVIALNV
jgi:hypothetical protein